MRIILFSALILTQCIPVVAVGAGATIVGLMCREKGLSGSLTDADLSARVRSNLAKFDYENNEKLSSRVNLSVSNSEVLLTGRVGTTNQRMLAEQAIWEVEGVKQVINHLQTEEEGVPTSSSAKDWALTAKVKSYLLGDKHIKLRAFNYAIRTVNGVVYVMGIAKNEYERNRTLSIISRVNGVQKVVSLVRLKHELI